MPSKDELRIIAFQEAVKVFNTIMRCGKLDNMTLEEADELLLDRAEKYYNWLKERVNIE